MNKFGNVKHGLHGTLTYKRWKSMRRRCSESNTQKSKYYASKGIVVCERWHVFENFLADMGECPNESMTLDRIDNLIGYQPGNCRWVNQREQNRNRSHCIDLTHNGKTMILVDWANEVGITPNLLRLRLFKLKWPVEKALSTPVKAKRKAAS